MSGGSRGVAKWIAELGITNTPEARAGIKTALTFFQRHLPESSHAAQLAYLKAMDLSLPVRAATLFPPFVVAASRLCNEDPLRLLYTKAGPVPSAGATTHRAFQRYRVARLAPVLMSHGAPVPALWTDDRRSPCAGVLQYLIPAAFRSLEPASAAAPSG